MGCPDGIPELGCCGNVVPPLQPGVFYIAARAANYGLIPRTFNAAQGNATRLRFHSIDWTVTYQGLPTSVLPMDGIESGNVSIDPITGVRSYTYTSPYSPPKAVVGGKYIPHPNPPLGTSVLHSSLAQVVTGDTITQQSIWFWMVGGLHFGTITVEETWSAARGDIEMNALLDGFLSLCDFDSFPANSPPKMILLSTYNVNTGGYQVLPSPPCVVQSISGLALVGSHVSLDQSSVGGGADGTSQIIYHKARMIVSRQTGLKTCFIETDDEGGRSFFSTDCRTYCLIEPPDFPYSHTAATPIARSRQVYTQMTGATSTCP